MGPFGLKAIVIEIDSNDKQQVVIHRENHYPLNVVAEQVNFGYYQSP